MVRIAANEITAGPQTRGADLKPDSNTGSNTAKNGRISLSLFEAQYWEQVLNLYQEVFGRDEAESFRARWNWAQERCLLPGENHKWVLLDGKRVVGFLATIPLLYLVKGEVVLAHTPCDYMVHPQYRFHGIKLIREFFRACPNCVTCDDVSSTIKVTCWLGAERGGTLVRHVKLLDFRALSTKWSWAGAAPFRWPINGLLKGWDTLRLHHQRGAYEVSTIREFDDRFDAFFQKLACFVPAMLVKDRRFLEWRYGTDSPHAGREVAIVADCHQEIMGYVIFYLSQKPGHTGFILDLQVLPAHSREIGRALLNHAIKRLRAQGAWAVRYHYFNSPYTVPHQVLNGCGFIPRGGHQFLVRLENSESARIARWRECWNYNYGDSEASHALT